MLRLTVSIAACFGLWIAHAFSADRTERSPATERAILEPFARGMRELQLGAGFFVSENYFDPLRPQMNDVDASVRLGWMLYSPTGPSFLRGNVEVVAEVFGGGFVRGPADFLAGTTLFFRYNYVQSGARLVPYAQVGGGGAYSDAHQEHPQRALGSAVSFNLQAGLGTRFFVTENAQSSSSWITAISRTRAWPSGIWG